MLNLLLGLTVQGCKHASISTEHAHCSHRLNYGVPDGIYSVADLLSLTSDILRVGEEYDVISGVVHTVSRLLQYIQFRNALHMHAWCCGEKEVSEVLWHYPKTRLGPNSWFLGRSGVVEINLEMVEMIRWGLAMYSLPSFGIQLTITIRAERYGISSICRIDSGGLRLSVLLTSWSW